MDPERLKMARAKLATEPYNLESWDVITRDAQSRKIDEARDVFEEIVEFFPTSGKFWKIYIEQEVNTYGPFVKIFFFKRHLLKCILSIFIFIHSCTHSA